MFAMFAPCSGMFAMLAMFACNSIAFWHVREHMFVNVRRTYVRGPKTSIMFVRQLRYTYMYTWPDINAV